MRTVTTFASEVRDIHPANSVSVNTLSYALLGTLSTAPRTGWEIAQHMKAPIAYMWAAGHSQIYPELNRLADAGLIQGTVITGRGPRDTKRYEITPAGRRVLAAWADSPLPPETPRSELLLRIRSLWLIGPTRAIAFVTAQQAAFANRLEALTEERSRFAPDDVMTADHPEFYAFATLQYGLARTRAALDWFDWLLGQLELQRTGSAPGQPRQISPNP